jgi:arylsulfatase A-like enzyme
MPLPNVLVVMTDQQKATSLGLYGNPDVRTPALERLAARGSLYRHAFCTHPLCVPSRASFFTGRWPHSTGVRTNEIVLPESEQDWVTMLLDQGYSAGLFGKNHVLRDRHLDRFDTVFEAGHGGPLPRGGTAVRATPLGPDGMPLGSASAARHTRYSATRLDKPREECTTALLAEQADQFIRSRDRDRPFFAWVSFPDPHEPYMTPEPYASMFDPAKLTMPPWVADEFANKPERQRAYHELFGFGDMPDERFRDVAAVYYGMIRFVDDALGRMLDTLDELSIADDTLVIFTSDHGDYAGEHRLLGKSNAFYDCLMRVPLVASMPGAVAAGAVHDELVSLADVMPTVLHVLGIETPSAVQGQVLPGVVGATHAPRKAIAGEYGAGGPAVTLEDVARIPREQAIGGGFVLLRQREAHGHGKMVRTHRWKYTHDVTGEVDELYDLEADPWELVNLVGRPDHAHVIAEMRSHLLDWMLKTEDARPVPLYF